MKITKKQLAKSRMDSDFWELSNQPNADEAKKAKSKFELYSESDKMSEFFAAMDKKIYGEGK